MDDVSRVAVRTPFSPTDPVKVVDWVGLTDRVPAAAFVDGVDLVIVRWDEQHSVRSGRCRKVARGQPRMVICRRPSVWIEIEPTPCA